jgi:hypothetical protein
VLISLLATLRGVGRSRAALHLEVLALRHQLQVLQRSRPRRLRLAKADRWLCTLRSRITPRPRGQRNNCAKRFRGTNARDIWFAIGTRRSPAGRRRRRRSAPRTSSRRPLTLAERLCGASDRVYSARVPRSHRHQQRARIAPCLGRVCPVLPEISNARGAGQGCARVTTCRAVWQRRDHRDSLPRWSASPVRPPRGIVRDPLRFERRPSWPSATRTAAFAQSPSNGLSRGRLRGLTLDRPRAETHELRRSALGNGSEQRDDVFSTYSSGGRAAGAGWSWSNCCWLEVPIRSSPRPSRGPHRSRGPNGVNMRRLHRSSGDTELTDSGSQSLAISGHQLARPPRAHPRSRSGRALPPTSSREPRVGLRGTRDKRLRSASPR